MKRSLIVGFVLVATLLLTSFVIPTVANEGNGMDEQTTTTHHLADTVSTAEIMRVNKKIWTKRQASHTTQKAILLCWRNFSTTNVVE